MPDMPEENLTRFEDRVRVRNVIVSIADKRGLDKLAPRLVESCPGVRFYATGGTEQLLRDVLGPLAPQRVVEMMRYSTRPVMHSRLARTVDFKIYIGLLADPWNEVHVNDLSAAGAVFFDMVIANSHPFPNTEGDLSVDMARSLIDIGGPGMIRAAVRNFVRVAPVVDPDDYDRVADRIEELRGMTDLSLRLELARKAFTENAKSDRKVSDFLLGLDPDKVINNFEAD